MEHKLLIPFQCWKVFGKWFRFLNNCLVMKVSLKCGWKNLSVICLDNIRGYRGCLAYIFEDEDMIMTKKMNVKIKYLLGLSFWHRN